MTKNYARSTGRKLIMLPVVVGLALFLFSGLALAEAEDDGGGADDPKSIITLPWENPAKKPVPPSFILPAQNRWGCLACHSNHNLSRIRDGREQSLFIDPDIIGASMHQKIACIDCHTNFTYEEHPASNPKDYRKVAGAACMKCHPFQAYLYRKSVHGRLALQEKQGTLAGKKVDAALCSDCHGSHNIQSPRFEPYKSEFRQSGREVCGQCHTDRYASFSDYYHGQAYKNKAIDAPACWDCHDNHRIVKKNNPRSPVGTDENLKETCGRCHDRPGNSFVSYAPLIHNRAESLEKNPIFSLLSIFIPKREAVVDEPQSREPAVKAGVVTESQEESILTRVFRFFFPQSLRPISG